MSKLPELENFINGGNSTPEVDRQQSLRNANTREELQRQLSCSAEQVEVALQASQEAYQKGEWEHTSIEERASILDQIAEELAKPENADEMSYADAITTGGIIHTTRKMASLVPFVFKGAAQSIRDGLLSKKMPGKLGDVDYFLRPWGPSLLISPWNGPTVIGAHKIASALAAGTPCILKPSEWAPHSAITMSKAIQKIGLPHGTFQLTLGNRVIGSQMVEDSRIQSVSFTGGLAGGRAIARACADDFKPTQLELGGNNPLVAFADADIEKTSTAIVYGITNLNAQWCRALGRLLVHESIKDKLMDAVLEKLANIKLGNSLDDASEMGPMVHEGQYNSILSDIEKLKGLGGTALSSTQLPDLNGYFIAPTFINGCKPEDTIDEIFGPVAAIHTFSSDEEALALANGTPFGLAGYVFSEDTDKAWAFAREMRTGGVKINGYSLTALSLHAPRSAWGLSGIGEEGHTQSIEFFAGARVVGISPQDPLGGR